MKAIILVAGMGTRLKPLTDNMPKCLTEVNGKAILINALEHLEKNGVNETILVVGYLSEKIKEKIGNNFGSMKISYVENSIYDKTNTSYSLWLALQNLDIEDNLLILEGDVFFEEQLLKNFIENSENSTVVQKYNPNLDGSFVSLNEEGIVTDWIHKTHRENSFVIENNFKTVNIHKFDKSFLNNSLIPILKKHIKEKQGTEPIEYIMRDIVKTAKINSFETGSLKWFEIDDINELKIAEKLFK